MTMFMLLCICLFGVRTLSLDLHNPQGIRMCEEQCRISKGCSGLLFEDIHLSCQLVLNDSSRSVAMQTKAIHDQCPVKTCIKGDRCIKSREKMDVCLHSTVSERSTEEVEDGTRTRILLIDYFERQGSHMKQVYVHTWESTTYPYLTLKCVTDVIFMPVSRRLLISTTKPNKLVSYPLDSNKATTLCENTYISHIAVDENRQLSFLLIKYRKKELARMPVLGKYYSVLKVIPPRTDQHDIALDSTRRMIYILARPCILCIPYEGGSFKKVVSSKQLNCMVFDSTQDALIYNIGLGIIMQSVTEKATSKVAELRVVPVTILLNKERLFIVSSIMREEIGVVDVSKKMLRYRKLKNYSKTHGYPLACLVS